MNEASKWHRTDNGEIVEVKRGLGDKYIVGTASKSGGFHRIKSPSLPAVLDPYECQENLDQYAAKKGWSMITKIEMPRKCRACGKTMPEMKEEKNDV